MSVNRLQWLLLRSTDSKPAIVWSQPRAGGNFRKRGYHAPARFVDGYLRGGLRAAAGGGVELCCDRRFEADIYRMDLSGIWARLSELRCPVHIWCGGESRHMDALGPGGSTEALYAKMAGAAAGAATRSSAGGGAVPLEVLGGLGHFGPLEDPGRFAKCLWERAGGQESTIRSRL